MARPKLQFSEQQNFRIAQMVEINMTLEEMVKDLKKNFNVSVSLPTLATHIKSLGLERVDNRKYNSHNDKNRVNGYVRAETVQSKEKSPSKYKLKKYYDCNEEASIEEVKALGYGKDGKPLNFRVIKGKDGNDEEIEMLVTPEQLSFKGGEKCKAKSLRWWMIERIKFDVGNRYHPLVPGQKKGDWRGVVDRLLYDDDDYCRVWGKVDIISLQQEAWERYVDAVYEYAKDNMLVGSDRHNHNRYVINAMTEDEFDELLRLGPDVIYKYIPPHLYGTIVCYCIDKMKKDCRYYDRDENILESVKKIMAHTRILITDYEASKISLEAIKKCLSYHPNDYDLVIKICVANALDSDLIKVEYRKSIVDMVSKLNFIHVSDPNNYNQCNDIEWLAANDSSLHRAVYGKFEDLNTVCEKYGILFGNKTGDVRGL